MANDAKRRFTGETFSGIDVASLLPKFLFLSRYLGFRRRLIRWLTVEFDFGRRVGTSPVKLTNHFPEVNPPTTLSLERRLTVSVAARRALRLLAVLHHFAEAGTSTRPNRESSPGTVSWPLRKHGVTMFLATYLLL